MHFDLDHHRIPGEYVGREMGDSRSLFLPFSLNSLGTSFCCVRLFLLGILYRAIFRGGCPFTPLYSCCLQPEVQHLEGELLAEYTT